jgi:hypothetical protein
MTTTPTSARRADGPVGADPRRMAKAPARGRTAEAGLGTSDEELTRQVARQTSSDRAVASFFERERDGAMTDVEAAKASADQLR